MYHRLNKLFIVIPNIAGSLFHAVAAWCVREEGGVNEVSNFFGISVREDEKFGDGGPILLNLWFRIDIES